MERWPEWAKTEGRKQEREKGVDQRSACAVAEITAVPARAEAADYHTETRNSPTAQARHDQLIMLAVPAVI